MIIPVYNRADSIGRAIRSVRAQRTAQPAEILVVDDHSNDGSGDIAADLGARVIRHTENRGAAAARNTAVAAASQPWLGMLDSDDEWMPHHLGTLWPMRHGHVLVTGASLSRFDHDPDLAPLYVGTISPRPYTLKSPAALVPQNPISASGVLVPRDIVRAVGGYNTELRYAEDWDLWLRVLERGTGVMTPRVVCLYHRHAGQKSQDALGPGETHDRILRSYSGRSWWSPELEQRWSGLQVWDRLGAELSSGHWTEAARLAAFLLAKPQRLAGVAQRRLRFWIWIYQARLVSRLGSGAGRSPQAGYAGVGSE